MAKDRQAASNAADDDFTRWSRQELVAGISELENDIKAIEDRVGSEDGDISDDDLAKFEADAEQNHALKAEMEEALNALDERRASVKSRVSGYAPRTQRTVSRPSVTGVSTPVVQPEAKGESVTMTESEDEKFIAKGPWKSLAHFAMEVKRAGDRPGLTERGLLGEWNGRVRKVDSAVKAMDPETKALSGLGELADDEGAAFVPIQIAAGVWERAKEMVDLMSLCDNTPVSGNNLTVRAWNDKSAASSYYGGAVAYWGAEAGQMTSSKPKTRDINLKLNKLHVLFYASGELLEDAPALDSELNKVAAYALVRKRNEALIRGTGAGQPMGLLNAACRVTQAAVSGQGANTITATNINAMWSRRAPDSDSRMLWLYIVDAETEFAKANYAIANATAATYVYIPAGGLSARGYDTLKGRRMIETAHCSALGTEGDIILFDPMAYKVISKSSGVNRASSLHLRFDYDETAFRWTQRLDGQPLWDAAYTPERGSTRSPIVTLNSTRT